MNLPFALRLAMRESRHGARRVGVYMASITLGVGALVSIHSFRDDVARSVRDQADVLMGADARFSSGRAFPDSVTSFLDSLAAEGVGVAYVTTALSMVQAPATEDVRLLQVQAGDGAFPYYGRVTTRPEGLWGSQARGPVALADPAVLTQLRITVGDTVQVGEARLVLVGTVDDVPTDLGFQTAIGPRLYISQQTLSAAGLLGFGSVARYQAFLRLPDLAEHAIIDQRYSEILRATRVRYELAVDQADDVSNGVRFLGRFLALVGLGALLLGGIGVASAVHVYIREKRTAVAVLRCLGADQSTVFTAYLVQASALGLLGAAVGVVLGVVVQQLLPDLLAGLLPVAVDTRLSVTSGLAGLGIGVWVAAIFALIPLLQVRDVPPLKAIRQDFEAGGSRHDGPYLGAYGALLASIVLLCVLEAPEASIGLGFAAGLAVAVAALAGTAWVLGRATRRFFPARASYPVRQGVSNLFRPQNQTVSVTLALGFGAFVVGTLLQVQGSLVDDLSVSFGSGQPNVLLFDVQRDQREGVIRMLPDAAQDGVEVAPLVPARITAINGVSSDELLARERGPDRPRGWALRREYRNTYRPALGRAEELVSGRWWDGTPGSEDGTRIDAGGLARVSLEVEVAEDLRVGLGDTLTWSVAGAPIRSIVTSLRRVEWGRLEPNFYAIFEPGPLNEAPQSTIIVARIPDPNTRAVFQRDLVGAFPNVSVLDFSRVQEALDGILSRVRQAVAFLGIFSAIAGVVVLVGALASSRVQRMREGALLKTLGARRGQVLVVLLAEYGALGTLATAAGLLLAWAASALVARQVFEIRFVLSPSVLLGIWLGVVGLTLAVGLAGSRSLLARPPLAVLRDVPE